MIKPITRLLNPKARAQHEQAERERLVRDALEAGREEGYWQGVNAWQHHDLFDTGAQDQLIGTNRERRAYDEHPAFTAAVETIKTLTLGNGVTYGRMQDDTAYAALEEWYALNDIGEYSKEILKTYLLDGEFLLLLAQDASPVEPAWLNLWDTREHEVTLNTEPGNPRVIASVTLPERTIYPNEFVYRSNRRRMNNPRGVSILRNAVTPAERYTRLVNEIRPRAHEIRARINAIYYAMANTQAELEQKASRYRRLPRDGNVLTLQIDPKTGQSEKLEMTNPRTEAGDAESDARGLIRTIAMVAGVPEHFMAIGDTANLATAKAMSEPMIRRMEGHQTLILGALTEAFRKELVRRYGPAKLYRVVRVIDEDGKRTRVTEYVPASELEIPFALPPVRDEEATDLKVVEYAHANGLISDQTATERLGFDPALESERLSDDNEPDPEQPDESEEVIA